ncbi:MAG: hypothetical protein RLZZ480_299 [Candidatus Parcubacteria bacterium]|jgi:hypothetical protein
MNEELETKEYLAQLEQIRLADSTRLRIREELLEHARFYPMEEVSAPVVSPFSWLLQKQVQLVLTLVLIVGATASLYVYNQSTDSTYVAMNDTTNTIIPRTINEEEYVPEPQNYEESTVAPGVVTQSESADMDEASDSLAMNTRAKSAPELESAFADDASMSTTLAQGAMDIDDYRADVIKREKTYRALIAKYELNIADDVRAELLTKLNTTISLTTESTSREEAEARPLLDKAMTLIGEVESSLSLLGAVTVEDGIITDIDFGASGSTTVSGGGVDAESPVDAAQ